MSYDPTQPAPGTSPASTRATIQGNFNEANIAIGRDHIPFSAATNEGLHRKVTLVELQSGTGPSLTGTQSALYMKTVGATQQLFFKNSAQEQQISDPFVVNLNNNGYIKFGGLLIQWVRVDVSATSGGVTVVSWPINFSGSPYNVQVTLRRNNDSTEATPVVSTANFLASSCRIVLPSGANNNGFFVLGIGKA